MTLKRIATQTLVTTASLIVALIVLVLLLKALQLIDDSVTATATDVLDAFYKGALRNTRKFADVVEFWIPLTLVSMGLVLTFRAGLWNIGVEGQMVLGGLFAAGAAYSLEGTNSSLIIIPASIIAAMIGGGLWAALAGALKVQFGVHEIFSGVALNFIASQVTLQMIAGAWRPAGSDKAQYSAPFSDASLWPPMSHEFDVSLLALVITLAIVVIVFLVLAYTRWGLQIKAAGRNPRSALLLGVPVTFTAISAIVMCGAFAGIGGAHRVLFTYENVRGQFSGGIGFLGLLVVLLTGNRAVLVPFVALAFAIIKAGSTQLQFIHLDTSLTGVIQSTLVLTVLLANGIKDRMSRSSAAEPVKVDTPAAEAVVSTEQPAFQGGPND